MYVEIGNSNAKEGYRDPTSDDPDLVRYKEAPGDRVTQIIFPPETTVNEAFQTTLVALGHHMEEGAKPDWVESDSDSLTALLCEQFGITKSGNTRPKTYGKDTGALEMAPPASYESADAPARSGGGSGKRADYSPETGFVTDGTLRLWQVPFALLFAFLLFAVTRLALRTDAGRDFQARVMGDTASNGTGSYAPASWIGLTANATAPAAADTTLTGEITTGTLARAQATYAHTNGTATYTLTKTFTSDQSVTIAKIGVFNAAAGGTMVFETLLNSTATLVSGDQLQITETVTL